MEAFTLDTSGRVNITSDPRCGFIRWEDLSPFAQGYVEALFAEFDRRTGNCRPAPPYGPLGFSDLSPEALAMILRDCEAYCQHHTGQAFADLDPISGRMFWRSRSAGDLDAFPPLTPYLADDGRVHLKEAAR